MRVIAKLRTTAAAHEADGRARLLGELTATAGTPVRLMHPETADLFVEAEAADAKSAAVLAARLRASAHVESAYVKPDPQLP